MLNGSLLNKEFTVYQNWYLIIPILCIILNKYLNNKQLLRKMYILFKNNILVYIFVSLKLNEFIFSLQINEIFYAIVFSQKMPYHLC